MPADFEVRGSHDLAVLAKRLKEAGEHDLRRQLLAGVRTSAKKAIPDVRESAETSLPRRGGLADQVAHQDYLVRGSYSGFGARVRLMGRGMKALRDLDAGRLRHPRWGDREHWYQQAVRPGYWTRPLLARRPTFVRDVEQVVHDVARQITRRF